MWVAKGLLPPLKLGMFVKPCRFIWCPIGWLVGGGWRVGCISQDTYLLKYIIRKFGVSEKVIGRRGAIFAPAPVQRGLKCWKHARCMHTSLVNIENMKSLPHLN